MMTDRRKTPSDKKKAHFRVTYLGCEMMVEIQLLGLMMLLLAEYLDELPSVVGVSAEVVW